MIKAIIASIMFLLTTACSHTPGLQLNAQEQKKYALAMQVAEASEKSGNPETEEAALKAAHQADPTSFVPVLSLVELYNLTGKYQQAASLIQEALHQFKDLAIRSELQKQQGIAYWHLQQPNLALDSMMLAYPNSRRPDVILNDLGVFLDRMGQHRLAQDCYSKGLRLKLNDDILINNYALSLMSSGNIKEVKELLNKPEIIGSSNSAVIANRNLVNNFLKEVEHQEKSISQIAREFRHQLGFDQSHPQITQENYQKINQLCHA